MLFSIHWLQILCEKNNFKVLNLALKNDSKFDFFDAVFYLSTLFEMQPADIGQIFSSQIVAKDVLFQLVFENRPDVCRFGSYEQKCKSNFNKIVGF